MGARLTPAARPVMVVAHRGASADAPENTMAAFALAWVQEADAIEGDFHLTADGQIVCMHDKDARRTGGEVDRKLAEMTLAEVRELDVGSWKDPKYADQRPPTLAEVIRSLPAGKRFLIEVKCGPEIVPELRRVFDAFRDRRADLRVISFDEHVIAQVKATMPWVTAYWLTAFKEDPAGALRPTIDEVLGVLARTKADGLDAQATVGQLDETFVGRLKAAGHELHVWTVDDPTVARTLAARGVDSITTNRPAFIRAALQARPAPATK